MARRTKKEVLQDRVDVQELEIQQMRLGQEVKLLESIGNRFLDDYIDPREATLGPDGEVWTRLDSDTRGAGNKNGAANIVGLNEARRQSRLLNWMNTFAIGAMKNIVNFTVGSGLTFRIAPKKNQEVDDGLITLIDDAQEQVDRFLKANHWKKRSMELVKRKHRDGDWFLRKFLDGPVALVRSIEPEDVVPPTDSGGNELDDQNSFGIRTAKDDVETIEGYWIKGESEMVPAEEVYHEKVNVDLNVKRGFPTFCPIDWELKTAKKLLQNMSVVTTIQAAIALIRKFPTTMQKATVEGFIDDQKDRTLTHQGSAENQFSKDINLKRILPGTILNESAGLQYEYPAVKVAADKMVAVLQALLRSAAVRVNMPEFMFTADASNNNFASIKVSDSPALRNFKVEQSEAAEAQKQVVWDCSIVWAVDKGLLPDEALEVLELQVESPELETKDEKSTTDSNETKHRNGILSKQTWSQQADLDYDQEQINFSEDLERNPEAPDLPLPDDDDDGPEET